MKLKKFAAMAVSAGIAMCAGMSMSANAAGASVSLPKTLSGVGVAKQAEEAETLSTADIYKNAVLNYADTHSCSFAYATIDIDGDFTDELIICPTEEFEERVAEVYGFVGGELVKVGEIPMGNGALFYDMSFDSCTPIVVMNGIDKSVAWHNFDGENVSEMNRVEEYDGSTDDFLELIVLTVQYNEDGTWSSTNIDGETVDGIDLEIFDLIYGDDDFGFDFVLPEIPEGASPAEESVIMYRAFVNWVSEWVTDDEINFMEISLFDMNKDGVPELIVKNGTCEADYVYEFITYDPETDEMEYLASDIGGHSALFMDTETGQLCSHYGQMGVGSITWYDFANGEITAQETAETFEYDAEDSYSAYAQYGDFVRVDSSPNYLNSEGAWHHFVDSETVDGFDTSVFDRYLANYEAAQNPETPAETSAPETTAAADSTTTATTTTGTTDSPKTGDNALPMLSAAIAVAGLTAFTLRKKND